MYYNVGSPRIFHQRPIQKINILKSDIWAIGVILYELLTNKSLDKDKKLKIISEIYEKMEFHFQIISKPF